MFYELESNVQMCAFKSAAKILNDINKRLWEVKIQKIIFARDTRGKILSFQLTFKLRYDFYVE